MEKYGSCKRCHGRGCGICGDTGFSGDAMDIKDSKSYGNSRLIKSESGRKSTYELIEIALSALVSSQKQFGRK